MPSPSASTRLDRTRYLSSRSPSLGFELCGPSRKKFSKSDRLTPIPDPVFRAGRLWVAGGVAAASRAAASLFDRARRCARARVAAPGVAADPGSASLEPSWREAWVCAMSALEVDSTWWDWIFRRVRMVRGDAGVSGPGTPRAQEG